MVHFIIIIFFFLQSQFIINNINKTYKYKSKCEENWN